MTHKSEAEVWADRHEVVADILTSLVEDGEVPEGLGEEVAVLEFLVRRFAREAERRDHGILVRRFAKDMGDAEARMKEWED